MRNGVFIYVCALCAMMLISAGTTQALEFEYEGLIEPEIRYFINEPIVDEQEETYPSIAAEIELGLYDDSGDHAFIIKPFIRYDAVDENRSHADLREAKYRYVNDAWEVNVGIDKVYWGVTEFLHLVDIINQTDAVESIDGEQKLGQPMVRLAYASDWGTFTGFYMPVFRPRTFSALEGRPYSGVLVDDDNELYEHEDEDTHQDYAFRYKHNIGVIDFGFSYFNGTARDPIISAENYNLTLNSIIPYYALLEQTALDVQATLDAWLWKLEVAHQDQLGESIMRATGGFEYSFYNIFGGSSDIGIVAEYMWDEREDEAPHIYGNDIGIGLRWTANDTQGTTLLIGTIMDMNYDTSSLSLEGERRLTDDLKLLVEARYFVDSDSEDTVAYNTRDEDFWRLRLAYYF